MAVQVRAGQQAGGYGWVQGWKKDNHANQQSRVGQAGGAMARLQIESRRLA